MKRIHERIGRELRWHQPSATRMVYELRDGDDPVASLRFRSSFGSFATAESADGCWTFKRVGFWRTRVSVRACDSEIDLAFFHNATWSGGGTCELAEGRRYPANSNFWHTEFVFKTEAGDPLVGASSNSPRGSRSIRPRPHSRNCPGWSRSAGI